MLDDAAMTAVHQWRFTPTPINGGIVGVMMTVTVNFTKWFSGIEGITVDLGRDTACNLAKDGERWSCCSAGAPRSGSRPISPQRANRKRRDLSRDLCERRAVHDRRAGKSGAKAPRTSRPSSGRRHRLRSAEGARSVKASGIAIRYTLRPPVAGERVRVAGEGQVVLQLRHQWIDGTTHVVFDPVEFLGRLALLSAASNYFR